MQNLFVSSGLSRAEGMLVHTAAEYLGCSERTVRRFIQIGKLRAETLWQARMARAQK
jgi:hypothetical protein